MIPKQIADKLRSGETPLNTCKVNTSFYPSSPPPLSLSLQVFTSVSILFSDIVSFTPMCARLRPMEVVSLLNAMYVAFDHLCEVNHVYKVTYSVSVIALCFLKHKIFCYISSYAQQLIIYYAIFVQPIT